ncbi:MAG: caspase family protein [Myxococcota bacterium]
MLWLLCALSMAEAGVTRHALIVSSNDGGAALPQLRYADQDAARFEQVLTELGGFARSNVTVLDSPDRDALLGALREHAWIAEQNPEDLFIFFYSGHADSRGLKLGEETLPYGELRQGVNELESEVRLGVLDACRSGEITRLKGMTLSEPFATDDNLRAEGEVWLTASSANEDAQESDRVQGGYFTHYLISGLRGAADTDDGVVSLREAYTYAYARTVARTGRTDAGAQHPTYDFNLQGEGDLGITDVRNASARLTLPESMAGIFTVLTAPDETPLVEVAKPADTQTVVALPPGDYLLRYANGTGAAESSLHLDVGSNFVVPTSFRPVREVAMVRGPTQSERPQGLFNDQFRNDFGEVDLEKVGAWMLGELGINGGINAVSMHELPEGPYTFAGMCVAIGPECLSDRLEGTGSVLLTYEDGQKAAMGALYDGQPLGRWLFFDPEGRPFAEGSYRYGIMDGRWTWWHPNGTIRQSGQIAMGARTGIWQEHYDNGGRKSKTRYELGAPIGRHQEWYPDGQKKSAGKKLGDLRTGRWMTYHPDGHMKSKGSYDEAGNRTGRWSTWTAGGQPSSRGRYLYDNKHGDWTFWWDSGVRSSHGAYRHGMKEGVWETWHPNGQKKSRGGYKNDAPDGRWVEWHANGQVKSRGRYNLGTPVGRWIRWDERGLRQSMRYGR